MVVILIILAICIVFAFALRAYINKKKEISEKAARNIIMLMVAVCVVSFLLVFFFIF